MVSTVIEPGNSVSEFMHMPASICDQEDRRTKLILETIDAPRHKGKTRK